ncbi:MAG: flagellar export protein FliJ [Hahellaceae bacterium]|nr:flagellar export protein FliJ [Hahellaceae bacterium]
MKRSQRLQIVLQLAARKEDEALQKLKQVQKELAAQEQRQSDLIDYQQSYMNNVRSNTTGANLAKMLTSYQQFLGQLQKAIEQQALVVDNARRQVQHYRDIWLALHHKHKGMGDFIERCKVQEEAEQEKKLQQQMDEASQRPRNRY